MTNEIIEKLIFESISHQPREASTVFILGAPRTGSTLFYQSLCNRFDLPFIANLTNDHYAETPIVGIVLQHGLPRWIEFTSNFGKTKGLTQPSEGSAVMMTWFGGGHPSQVVSSGILPGREPHFLRTLSAVEDLFGAPLAIKNAWNCFRVAYLAQALPKARFIWIRRDAGDAAKSDLSARIATKGSPWEWNSATPANVEALRKLPPNAQVVENQHEFNRAILTGLEQQAQGRWIEVWYEDFCGDPDVILSSVGAFLGTTPNAEAKTIQFSPSGRWCLEDKDVKAVDDYLASESARLTGDRHPSLRQR